MVYDALYDTFIFDLDGTLIYTPFEFRYLLVNKTLKRFGLELNPVKHRNVIDDFWFSSRRDEIIRENFGLDPEDFWAEYRIHDTVGLRTGHAKPYDDWVFIRKLKEMGKKTGIVTGAPTHIAYLYLYLMDKDLFDSFILARESQGLEKKPNPQALNKCIRELGADREGVVYTGNSEEDIIMGNDAGVLTVHMDREEWEISREPEPILKIHSLYELEALI